MDQSRNDLHMIREACVRTIHTEGNARTAEDTKPIIHKGLEEGAVEDRSLPSSTALAALWCLSDLVECMPRPGQGHTEEKSQVAGASCTLPQNSLCSADS